MILSSSGEFLATGAQDKLCIVRDATTCASIMPVRQGSDVVFAGEVVSQLRGHTNTVLAIIFVDDHRLVTTSDDYSVRIWDFRLGTQLHVLTGQYRI